MSDKDLSEKEIQINKAMQANLLRMSGDEQDSEDIAYVMLDAYLKTQNIKMIDEKLYRDKKHIADLIECNHDGECLTIRLKMMEPMHYIMLDLNFREGSDGKSKD